MRRLAERVLLIVTFGIVLSSCASHFIKPEDPKEESYLPKLPKWSEVLPAAPQPMDGEWEGQDGTIYQIEKGRGRIKYRNANRTSYATIKNILMISPTKYTLEVHSYNKTYRNNSFGKGDLEILNANEIVLRSYENRVTNFPGSKKLLTNLRLDDKSLLLQALKDVSTEVTTSRIAKEQIREEKATSDAAILVMDYLSAAATLDTTTTQRFISKALNEDISTEFKSFEERGWRYLPKVTKIVSEEVDFEGGSGTIVVDIVFEGGNPLTFLGKNQTFFIAMENGLWKIAGMNPMPKGPVLTKSPSSQNELRVSDDFLEGMAAFRSGHLKQAIARFDKVSKSDPNYLVAIGFTTVSLIWLHEPADAEARLTLALKEHPDSIILLGARASVLQETGKPQEASSIADKIIRLSANTAWEYATLAGAYLLKGNADASIRNYSKAIEKDPTRAEFYDSRGMAFGVKQDYQNEIDDHSRAIEIDPQAAVSYMNRGAAYGYQKKYDSALQDYDKAIALNANLAMAYVNRGATRRIHRNDINGAISDYNKAIMIDAKLPVAYYNRGFAWRQKNDFEKAIVDYTKAIALKPDYQTAYHSRGAAHWNSGGKSKGCSDWKKAYELERSTPIGMSANRNWKGNCGQ